MSFFTAVTSLLTQTSLVFAVLLVVTALFETFAVESFFVDEVFLLVETTF